ncbi:MAG: hypothetical protein ACLTKI_08885, partial [Lachnospiraceae bacterium]
FGRPRIDNLEEFEVVLHAWESGEITKAAAAERLGISLRTYHKRVVEFRNRREQSPADRVRHIEKEIEEKRR